ncbi:hypothetical protein LG290_11935 [Halomonas sediminis]
MISTVKHVASRCGGGKSYHTLQRLLASQVKLYPDHKAVIFASKTNSLNKQNYATYLAAKAASEDPNKGRIHVRRIDAHDFKGKVVKTVSDTLEDGFLGIIFTSHAVLGLIDPKLLSGVMLIIDEIPQGLVKPLSIKYEAEDSGDSWETNIVTQPSSYDEYEEVLLSPKADHEAIKRVIHNVRTNKDNTRTKEVADLLEFLLAGYDKMYVTTYVQRRSFRYYQAIHWHKLKLIAEQVESLVILSAQLKDSLFGFVVEHCLELPIVNFDIEDDLTLETKHKNKVKIIPFLIDARWSSSLKQKPVDEVLCFADNQPLSVTNCIAEYAQRFAEHTLAEHGFSHFIMTLNHGDTVLERLKRDGVVITTTAVHGMNHLKRFDHAVYLASNRPNPFELKHLKMFAQDHGATPQKIERAVTTERCLETAYQCIARTSIRLTNPDLTKEHIFIVPDMEYARYLAKWFEQGCVSIDPSYAHTKRETRACTKQVVIQIRRDYLTGKDNLKNLVAQAGVEMYDYKHAIRKHREELGQLGILGRKSKNAEPA